MTTNLQTSVSRARLGLADRLLTLGSADDVRANLPYIDRHLGGVVVLGSQARAAVRDLHRGYPDLMVLEQPLVHLEHTASAAAPFVLPTSQTDAAQGSLFEVQAASMDEVLDAQVDNGASLAVLPTAFIAGNDVTALRAVVEAANKIRRDDTILHLPLAHVWVSGAGLDKLIAGVRRSLHPVTVSLAHKSDPGSQAGVVEGLRRLVKEAPDVSLWFTDLCGVDALAHGARAAAIGVASSHRHIVAPGETAYSPSKHDRSPNLLMRDLLRYRKSRHMKQDWYASAPPPTCEPADCCAGKALDNFDGSTGDRNAAHRHNVTQLTAMHHNLLKAPSRKEWWADQLKGAELAHARVALETGVKTVKPTGALKRWIELNANYGTES